MSNILNYLSRTSYPYHFNLLILSIKNTESFLPFGVIKLFIFLLEIKKGHLFIRCPDTITIYFFKESLVHDIF